MPFSAGFPISIHAPRVGSDGFNLHIPSIVFPFQSTLPVWGATISEYIARGLKRISIQAPRVGSDNAANVDDHKTMTFQSTLPVWGATASFL